MSFATSVSVAASQPRVRNVPDWSFSYGEEAIELAADVGLVLDEWQRNAVLDIMADRGEEVQHWRSFESALIVPRQSGKGAVLECIELAELFLFSEHVHDYLIVHTAHEFRTSQEAFRRVRYRIENSDMLRSMVKAIPTAAGNEGVELKSGARLRFLARSGGAGRGFSADRLIYDEAYDLPEETIAASMPIMSARPNPAVIYTSSAPLDNEKSKVLRRVMSRGRMEDDRRADPNLCYLEFSADPKCDLDDQAQWAQANPGVAAGRITIDFISKERATMSDVTFARERLGIVDESKNATVIDMDLWAACGDEMSSAFDPVCFAIDIGPAAAYTSIAIAGMAADGRIHTEVVARSKGTGWVVDRIEELREKWHPTSIVMDPIGPVGSLLPSFAVAGVPIVEFGLREHAQACGLFKALVEDGKLVHKNQPGLTAALESARKRDAGEAGAWLWNRRDETDISPLVAVTLAVFAQSKTKATEPEAHEVIVFR